MYGFERRDKGMEYNIEYKKEKFSSTNINCDKQIYRNFQLNY